jgi:hypothetical protein
LFRIAIIATIFLSAGLSAQQSPQAGAPVKLELRCPAPCTFRQGESIWLDLDYTASSPGYSVLTNYTDRDFGRDEFIAMPPEGASDPVAPYLPIVQPQGGSFAFRRVALSDRPVTVRMNLNQWVRFDGPGEYHISAISHRVSDSSRPRSDVWPKSNEIAITIVAADPQWQREQLTRILRTLDATPVPYRRDSIPNALRELCDLGTEDAAIEIAHRIGTAARDLGFRLYEMALIRSPFRTAAIREMERLLADPDTPISSLFLLGLANVSVDPSDSRAQMAQRAAAKRAEVKQALMNSLPRKRGQARDASDAALRSP